MIRHAFTLIWNRKRANALIMLELVVTFLILFALGELQPEPVSPVRQTARASTWRTSGRSPWAERGAFDADDEDALSQTAAGHREADGRSERRWSSCSTCPSIFGAAPTLVTRGKPWRANGMSMALMSPALPRALGMKLLEGRWFGRAQDDTQSAADEIISPVVESAPSATPRAAMSSAS